MSDRLLTRASADSDIVGAAVVGSLATGPGDRWSDLDIQLAVAAGAATQLLCEEAAGEPTISPILCLRLRELMDAPGAL